MNILYLDAELLGDALTEEDVDYLTDFLATFAADRGLSERTLVCGLRNDEERLWPVAQMASASGC